jgi:hypothetical protein
MAGHWDRFQRIDFGVDPEGQFRVQADETVWHGYFESELLVLVGREVNRLARELEPEQEPPESLRDVTESLLDAIVGAAVGRETGAIVTSTETLEARTEREETGEVLPLMYGRSAFELVNRAEGELQTR